MAHQLWLEEAEANEAVLQQQRPMAKGDDGRAAGMKDNRQWKVEEGLSRGISENVVAGGQVNPPTDFR
jgi:hypothetical protein